MALHTETTVPETHSAESKSKGVPAGIAPPAVAGRNTTATAPSPAEARRPNDWFKDAVIYQLHVRSFYDSNGDGIGDFAGLTEKLDYVASLGVTTIWLLPFYPSPLRDEGYDIADYTSVNPIYGTLDDFKKFLDAAHRLGLSVVTELVINHTSDQHPWFQRARRAPKGSPERAFYVWNDDSDRYPEVRIIFQDFEPSNWTWDPIAGQYYWHRFYSHQPDLNFDNPAVKQAVFDVVDFWLELGVDGMRLDAIPYLFERDDTNCESLPETHAYLRELRAHIDRKYPDRFLLAEANQWPDETAAYFGADDECQMCFNFPLMPRLFMAVQQEERFPIVDILRHTPDPPAGSQWAIFLRNHDELTLEMVTDEERDAMYRFYATDPQSKVNLGLRRRLAPLLRDDRRRLELMHALLFALPGTPVMYYGDEIRMGDNIFLRDRDGVRTPMQWSSDRNAGFSRSNPQRLFLPVNSDPEFHYQSRNVETEEQSPHSFLWWLRRVLRLRRRHKAFGRGTLEFLQPHNPRILAFIRKYEDETLLVVVNLSRLAQFVELDLSEFRGRRLVELFGQTKFPLIGDLPYMLTLGPHGFYWFRLDWPRGQEDRRAPSDLPVVRVARQWTEAFQRPLLEQTCDALADYLARQAWHLAPHRQIRALETVDVVSLPGREDDGATYVIAIVRVHYVEGESSLYHLALVAVGEKRAHDILRDRPTAGVLQVVESRPVEGSAPATWFVCDATNEAGYWRHVAPVIADGELAAASGGRLRRNSLVEHLSAEAAGASAVTPLWRTSDTRGTVAAMGNHLFLKMLRRIEPGAHPEVEMATALATRPGDLPLAKLVGTWDYQKPGVGAVCLGLAFEFVPYEHALAAWCRGELRRTLELAAVPGGNSSTPPAGVVTGGGPTVEATSAAGNTGVVENAPPQGQIERRFHFLGRRLGAVHIACSDVENDPAFAPETITTHYRRSLHHAFRTRAQRTFELLREHVRSASNDRVIGNELELLRLGARCEARFAALLSSHAILWRIRCHGSLGLGKVLMQGDDLRIVDWGGAPDRSFGERRLKRSVFGDLARLALSIDGVTREATAKLAQQLTLTEEGTAKAAEAAKSWRTTAIAALLSGYRESVQGELLIPEDDTDFQRYFGAFRLNETIELLYTALERGQQDRIEGLVADALEQLA
jgi:maltose alpha-D-glucosyltransferase/alpha-amylase